MSKPEAIVFEDGQMYWKTMITNLLGLPLYFFANNLCVKSEPQNKIIISKYNKNNKLIYLIKL